MLRQTNHAILSTLDCLCSADIRNLDTSCRPTPAPFATFVMFTPDVPRSSTRIESSKDSGGMPYSQAAERKSLNFP